MFIVLKLYKSRFRLMFSQSCELLCFQHLAVKSLKQCFIVRTENNEWNKKRECGMRCGKDVRFETKQLRILSNAPTNTNVPKWIFKMDLQCPMDTNGNSAGRIAIECFLRKTKRSSLFVIQGRTWKYRKAFCKTYTFFLHTANVTYDLLLYRNVSEHPEDFM